MCKITKKNIELYYPFALSLVLTMTLLVFFSKFPLIKELGRKLLLESNLTLIITIESTLFGFLLAVLALILQMNNKLIESIKRFNRYNDLISFCKKAVYSSFFTIFSAFIILIFMDIYLPYFIRLLFYSFFYFSFIYNILTTYRFINIFFKLAKSN